MGTNYYLPTPPCENACKHCSREPQLHICKSLVSFQAYHYSDLGPLLSWEQWKRAILEADDDVVDEYGITYPTDEFIASVEATDLSDRRRQYDWMRDHYEVFDDYLDDQGFTFTQGEFS